MLFYYPIAGCDASFFPVPGDRLYACHRMRRPLSFAAERLAVENRLRCHKNKRLCRVTPFSFRSVAPGIIGPEAG